MWRSHRPHSPTSAAKVVEIDWKNALFRAQSRKVGRAADEVEVQAAKPAADEEARGAGVVRFGMLLTATVTDPADLPAAVAAVDSLAEAARIRVRRVYGSQSISFLAALPLGMSLRSHLRIPAVVRDAM